MAEPEEIQQVLDDQKKAKELKKANEAILEHLDDINDSVERNSDVSQVGIGMLLDNFKVMFDYRKGVDKSSTENEKVKNAKISELISFTKKSNAKDAVNLSMLFTGLTDKVNSVTSSFMSAVTQISPSDEIIAGSHKLAEANNTTQSILIDGSILNAFGLKAIKDQLENDSFKMASLVTGLTDLLITQAPEKSEITQQIQAQQAKELEEQAQRLIDRDIQMQILGSLNGMGNKLNNLQTGGGEGGGGGGGFLSGLLGAFTGPWMTKVLGMIGTGLTTMFTKMGGLLKTIGVGAFNILKGAGGLLKTGLTKAFGLMRGAFTSIATRLGPVLARVGSSAISMLGPAVAVAGAAAAGWAVGSWLNKKFGISDKIAEKLSADSDEEVELKKKEKEAFSKKNEATTAKHEATKELVASGVDEKQLARFKGGKDIEKFQALEKEQQDLVMKAIKEQSKAVRQDAKMALDNERFLLDDTGLMTSTAEQTAIDQQAKNAEIFTKSANKLSNTARMFADAQKEQGDKQVSMAQEKSIALEKEKQMKTEAIEERQEVVEKVKAEAEAVPVPVEVKLPSNPEQEAEMKAQNEAIIRILEDIAESNTATANKKNQFVIPPSPRRSANTSVGGMPVPVN